MKIFRQYSLFESFCISKVLRKEVLFYHQVLELALDQLLQALFAKNRCYFPSRKRTEAFLESFQLKPENCYNRILQIISNASDCNTIDASLEELRALTSEILESDNFLIKK